MVQCFLLFLFFSIIATSLSFALDNTNDDNDNLFFDEINNSDNSDTIFQDSPITSDDSNLSLDPIFSSSFNADADADADESNNINLLASCLPPDNQLRARDEQEQEQKQQQKAAKRNNLCPSDNNDNNNNNPPSTPPIIPQLQFPSLDDLLRESRTEDQTYKSIPLLGYSAAIVVKAGDTRAKNPHICPPHRIFYLCCLCDMSTDLSTSCFDCLPS